MGILTIVPVRLWPPQHVYAGQLRFFSSSDNVGDEDGLNDSPKEKKKRGRKGRDEGGAGAASAGDEVDSEGNSATGKESEKKNSMSEEKAGDGDGKKIFKSPLSLTELLVIPLLQTPAFPKLSRVVDVSLSSTKG